MRRDMKTHPQEVSVGVGLGVMLLALALFAPSFYQPKPLLSLLTREAPALIVTCGAALVIITRQIDISIGSQFAVCCVCSGLLAALHWPIIWVLFASIGIGVILGTVNGLFVAGLGLPSIVVTLATMATWRELLRWKQQGAFVNLPNGVQWFGLNQTSGQWVIVATALVVLVALGLATRHLAAGRILYAVGSDAEATRLAGISPRIVTFFIFVGMGALTGLAALLNVLQSPQVDPKSALASNSRRLPARWWVAWRSRADEGVCGGHLRAFCCWLASVPLWSICISKLIGNGRSRERSFWRLCSVKAWAMA